MVTIIGRTKVTADRMLLTTEEKLHFLTGYIIVLLGDGCIATYCKFYLVTHCCTCAEVGTAVVGGFLVPDRE